MSAETTELQDSATHAALAITTIKTARAAISGLGRGAPTGAVRGLDIALASLDEPGPDMAQVAGDLRFRACNLLGGDSYRRQCALALTFVAALVEIFLETVRGTASH